MLALNWNTGKKTLHALQESTMVIGGRQETSLAAQGPPAQNKTQEENTQAVGEGLCFPGRI